MTPKQKRLIHDLSNSRISRTEFLRSFPFAGDGSKLSLALLEEAIDRRDVETVELALGLGFVFGFSSEHKAILRGLVEADWHRSHEDAVFALDDLRDPDAVDILYKATHTVPDYLSFDDNRALAVKAIWALGNIGSAAAKEKLEIIARSNNVILRDAALHQLERFSCVSPS